MKDVLKGLLIILIPMTTCAFFLHAWMVFHTGGFTHSNDVGSWIGASKYGRGLRAYANLGIIGETNPAANLPWYA